MKLIMRPASTRLDKPLRGSVAVRAFTLIELLVVIAIIGILASMLLPALGTAKKRAHTTKCLSNMKQWSTAIHMYLNDSRDIFPHEGNSGDISTAKNLSAWFNQVPLLMTQPALKDLYAAGTPPLPNSTSIYGCPSTVTNLAATPTVTLAFFMYAFNNRMDPNDTVPGRNNRFFTVDQVVNPSQTGIFTENNESNFPSTSGLYTMARHDRKANIAICDVSAALFPDADFRRTAAEDSSSALDWSMARKVYWYPFNGAPN